MKEIAEGRRVMQRNHLSPPREAISVCGVKRGVQPVEGAHCYNHHLTGQELMKFLTLAKIEFTRGPGESFACSSKASAIHAATWFPMFA